MYSASARSRPMCPRGAMVRTGSGLAKAGARAPALAAAAHLVPALAAAGSHVGALALAKREMADEVWRLDRPRRRWLPLRPVRLTAARTGAGRVGRVEPGVAANGSRSPLITGTLLRHSPGCPHGRRNRIGFQSAPPGPRSHDADADQPGGLGCSGPAGYVFVGRQSTCAPPRTFV